MLSNIFYLLQVLAPGMLAIYHEYQLSDKIVKVSRMLPRVSWIQRNHMLRMEVMGSTDALLTAVKNQTIVFHEERTAWPCYNLPHSSATTTTLRLGYYNVTMTNPGLGYQNDYISTAMEEFDGLGTMTGQRVIKIVHGVDNVNTSDRIQAKVSSVPPMHELL